MLATQIGKAQRVAADRILDARCSSLITRATTFAARRPQRNYSPGENPEVQPIDAPKWGPNAITARRPQPSSRVSDGRRASC